MLRGVVYGEAQTGDAVATCGVDGVEMDGVVGGGEADVVPIETIAGGDDVVVLVAVVYFQN